LLGAASCGAGGGTPERAKKGGTSVATVRFLALGGGASLQWQEQQFAKFNETAGAQAKVQVKAEPEADQTKLFQKFEVTSAGGDPPDVTRLKEVWVFESAAKGSLAKLDGYFKNDKDLPLSDLLPRFQDAVTYKGSHYAVARECSILIPFYNKELFASAGLNPDKPPATYEEFREYARRLTKPNPADPAQGQYGFEVYEYGTREIIMFWFLGMVRRFGGDFWNKDKTAVAINSPAGYEAMEYFVELIQKDRSAVPPGVKVSNGRALGKIGMWETGTWQIPAYPRSAPDLKFGLFLWPKKVTANQSPSSGSSAIAKASKDVDAAWEFVKWWNQPAQQLGFYENAGGNAPSRKSAFEAPPFTTDPYWKIALPGFSSPDGKARPSCERYNELAESMTPHLLAGWKGEKPARQAVDDATQAATEFWKSIGGSAAKAGG
jgi:multiple sugar transport system substrate-binding protein